MLSYLLSAVYVVLWALFGWLAGRFLPYYVSELKAGRVATRKYAVRWIATLGGMFILAGSIGEIVKAGYLLHENVKGVGVLAAVVCFGAGYFIGRRKHGVSWGSNADK